MRSRRVRSRLATAVVLALFGLGWFYLAPTQIGGSTRYVVTHGVSMEPLLHTGDLVLVRPADNYRVGQVVAYHSTLLHTVVLHRIIRVHRGHYFFKGDNNHFVDPTHPTRGLLVGRMWLLIPNGGVVLSWLHNPWVAGGLLAGVATLLLLGGDRERRRDRGRRRHSRARRARRALPVSRTSPQFLGRASSAELFSAAVLGMLVFAALAVVAFVRPTATTTSVKLSYTQQVSFGYHGSVAAGPVYPNGTVSTGDPIYVQLVHRIGLTAAYQLTTTATHRVHGTIQFQGVLTNTSGWSRNIWLGSSTPFAGDRASVTAQIDISQLESLTNRITAQIGAVGGSYTLAVVPHVKLAGEIAGQRISRAYSPALDLSLGTPQVLSGASSAASSTSSPGGASQQGLVRSTTGAVTSSRTSTSRLAGVPVEAVRWIAVVALALFALLAWLVGPGESKRDTDPQAQINRRYKHLLVPVAPLATEPDRRPIEVRTIDALAQLAERSERLILHEHRDDVDNYLIDDQGTMFQFTAPRVIATNGNGATSLNGTGAGGTNGTGAGGTNGTAAESTNGTAAESTNKTPAQRPTGTAARSRNKPPSESTNGAAAGGSNGTAGGRGGTNGKSDPSPIYPATDAAAAILSSAAATLSAAAARASAAPSGANKVFDPVDPPNEPTPVAEAPAMPVLEAAAKPLLEEPASAAFEEPAGAVVEEPARPVLEEIAVPSAPMNGDTAPAPGPADTQRPRISQAAPRWRRQEYRLGRPDYRLGYAIGPLALMFLAWRRLQARRRRDLGLPTWRQRSQMAEPDEQDVPWPDRRYRTSRRAGRPTRR